jgi:acetyl-CoA synthetase
MNVDLHNYDLSALEHVAAAGELLSEEVFQNFKMQTGLSIHEAYGQTETTPLIMTSRYSKPKLGSVGLPSPAYDLAILDEEGNEVPRGCEGEICVRATPGDLGIFTGYYGDEVMFHHVWRGGVYHTGDLAVQDEQGYIKFIGRADDIIKSSGYRIGPYEVESVVLSHPAVLECAAVGVPHPLRGQVVKANIVLKDGYKPSPELMQEIRAYTHARTSSYKVPRIIEFVTELPKTISGKIMRPAKANPQMVNNEATT